MGLDPLQGSSRVQDRYGATLLARLHAHTQKRKQGDAEVRTSTETRSLVRSANAELPVDVADDVEDRAEGREQVRQEHARQ